MERARTRTEARRRWRGGGLGGEGEGGGGLEHVLSVVGSRIVMCLGRRADRASGAWRSTGIRAKPRTRATGHGTRARKRQRGSKVLGCGCFDVWWGDRAAAAPKRVIFCVVLPSEGFGVRVIRGCRLPDSGRQRGGARAPPRQQRAAAAAAAARSEACIAQHNKMLERRPAGARIVWLREWYR